MSTTVVLNDKDGDIQRFMSHHTHGVLILDKEQSISLYIIIKILTRIY